MVGKFAILHTKERMILLSNKTNEAAKSKSMKDKFGIDKKKVVSSLLTGFAVPFILLICSTLSVYFSNSSELDFAIKDFLPIFLLISLGLFAFISLILLLAKGVFRNTLFALFSGIVVCAYIQSMITTMTFSGLPGDGNTEKTAQWVLIFNLFVWLLLLAAAVWFGALSQKADTGRTVLCFLMVLVIVMQTVSIVPAAINFTSKQIDVKNDPTTEENAFLTDLNMFELSTKDNVVIFILDRFDRYYYKELINYNPDFFKDYDGFTYYDDNISTYPRTYPAITSMLTGMDNDYSDTRTEYFKQAYTNSTFLRDMKANDYKINLFIPSFYGYETASVFGDLVANSSASVGYTITSYGELTSKMFSLGSYFWMPELLKSQEIASNSFVGLVDLNGDAQKYEMTKTSDPDVYKRFKEEGISTQSKENTFTFLHLRGCHSPYTMDENCNVVPESSVTSLQQTRGSFKFISEYIAEMKELGIYEDATIIITGDHAALNSDSKEYTDENLTALLVKQKGQQGTPMKTSNAPVCQDNLHAEIIKSAGIKTVHDYGTAYSEIPEDAVITRTHFFQVYTGSEKKDVNVTYEITGPGTDFNNWKITNREEIGYMYK